MKKRIVIYSVFLGVLTIMTILGLVNLILETKYTNNDITFTVNNKEAYFVASGQYYYGNVSEPTKTYSAQYTQEDLYKGEQITIEEWNIGESVFVPEATNEEDVIKTLKYVITITNRNDERNLSIKLNNVAVHKDGYFTTEIKFNDEQVYYNAETNYINKNNMFDDSTNTSLVSAKEGKVIGVNGSLKITIVMNLITRSKPINAVNNFNFELTSVQI